MRNLGKLSIFPLGLCCGLALVIFLLLAGELAAQSSPGKKPTPPAKPSLDSLVERASSYWSLLEKGSKLEALKYVVPSSREYFTVRQIHPFRNPRVTGLELLGKSGQVRVSVTVDTTLPPVGNMNWQVSEDWTFTNGNWFAVVQNKQFLLPTGEGRTATGPSPQELDQRQNQIRTALHFESQAADFGTVKRGETAVAELRYALDGDAPFDFRFKDVPPDVPISCRVRDAKLKPGKNQSVPLELSTENYNGQIQIPLTMQVKSSDVEVLYPIEIRGMVYSPVSVTPLPMFFAREEKQKDVEIRNNSKSEIRIVSATSETGVTFVVGPLPLVLPPGGQAVVKVQTPSQITQSNYRDSITLAFDKAVDGVSSVPVPVTVNYVRPTGGPPLTQKELEELKKKAQQPPVRP